VRRRRESGQATVELALALPVLVVVMLLAVQVGLLVCDDILVVHAAREAARAAAVSSNSAEVSAAARRAAGLDPARLSVDVGSRGGAGSAVTVTVRYRAPTDVPIVGAFFGDYEMAQSVTMRVER
jgi:Flp pilus assembly protein TadG